MFDMRCDGATRGALLIWTSSSLVVDEDEDVEADIICVVPEAVGEMQEEEVEAEGGDDVVTMDSSSRIRVG